MRKKNPTKPPKQEAAPQASEHDVLGTIRETGATASAEPLPKGTALENEVAAATAPEEKSSKKRDYKREYERRKSREKGEAPAERPAEDQPDVLTPALNGFIIPIAAKRLNRKPEQLMLTDAEMSELKKLQPPSKMNQPSWGAYFITAVSLVVIKYFETEELKPAAPVPPAPAPGGSRSSAPPEEIPTVTAEIV